MCEFVSWIEKPGKDPASPVVLFMTAAMLDTPKGREIAPDDRLGHGAIRQYFGLEPDEGQNRECTDFSTPANFPPQIVAALKAGEFAGLARVPVDLLRKPLYADYSAKRNALDAEFWAMFAVPENRAVAWR